MEQEPTAEKLKMQPSRIGIMGAMASGKSTVTGFLSERWGIESIEERVNENPYIKDFYLDAERFSFRSQICFLTLNTERMENKSDGPIEIFEAPIQNDNLFCQTQHEIGFMDKKERDLYLRLYRTVTQDLGIVMPDFYIVMDAPAEVLYKRIIDQRGRDFEHPEFFEEHSDYLERLVNTVAEWAEKTAVEQPVIVVDSVNNNLVDSAEDRERVFEQIESEIANFLSKNPCRRDGTQFIIPDFLKVK